jgi:hypothetical protein
VGCVCRDELRDFHCLRAGQARRAFGLMAR